MNFKLKKMVSVFFLLGRKMNGILRWSSHHHCVSLFQVSLIARSEMQLESRRIMELKNWRLFNEFWQACKYKLKGYQF